MSRIAINAFVASVMAGSLVAGTSAQNKPAPQTGTSITVIGCLKKWEPSMAGRGGIQNPSKFDYVLTDLAPGTAATTALPNVLRYAVMAKDTTVALTAHLNHRIEATGMVTGLGDSKATADPSLVPMLTISTVKMVSTECI